MMKVSFSGNHLLQFRNNQVRDKVYDLYCKNADLSTTGIYKYNSDDLGWNSGLLVVDGHDKEDFDALLRLNLNAKNVVACLKSNLIQAYAQQAKKVDSTYICTL